MTDEQRLIPNNSDDKALQTEVQSGVEWARNFAKSLTAEDVKSGAWFARLLQKVVSTYDRNARAEYFQKKYPGFSSDEIADKLIGVAVNYAAIVGGVAGVGATAGVAGLITSAGASTALFVSVIGVELITLTALQLRLVLDLSVIYGLQLDADDPEDILLIFNYALGIAPTEAVGKVAVKGAGGLAKLGVKSFMTGSTRVTITKWSSRIGLKILQRTMIKFAVPVVSAAVGSGYNALTTRAVGRIAREHFRNRDNITEELRNLVDQQRHYGIVFPAAAMYVAKVDGVYHDKEREFYGAIVSWMTLTKDEDSRAFKKMVESETDILAAIAALDAESKEIMLRLLTLMAVYDGELAEAEYTFLLKIADEIGMEIDRSQIEGMAETYVINAGENIWQETTNAAGNALHSGIETGKGLFSGAGKHLQTGYSQLFGGGAEDDQNTKPVDG